MLDGELVIDWSISGGDYVQLRIGCPREAKISVSPLPGGPYMQCFEPGKNLSEFNFPLTDSMILEFTNWADPRAPAQIVLTLQPVLKGVADPRYSKQLTTEAAPARR